MNRNVEQMELLETSSVAPSEVSLKTHKQLKELKSIKFFLCLSFMVNSLCLVMSVLALLLALRIAPPESQREMSKVGMLNDGGYAPTMDLNSTRNRSKELEEESASHLKMVKKDQAKRNITFEFFEQRIEANHRIVEDLRLELEERLDDVNVSVSDCRLYVREQLKQERRNWRQEVDDRFNEERQISNATTTNLQTHVERVSDSFNRSLLENKLLVENLQQRVSSKLEQFETELGKSASLLNSSLSSVEQDCLQKRQQLSDALQQLTNEVREYQGLSNDTFNQHRGSLLIQQQFQRKLEALNDSLLAVERESVSKSQTIATELRSLFDQVNINMVRLNNSYFNISKMIKQQTFNLSNDIDDLYEKLQLQDDTFTGYNMQFNTDTHIFNSSLAELKRTVDKHKQLSNETTQNLVSEIKNNKLHFRASFEQLNETLKEVELQLEKEHHSINKSLVEFQEELNDENKFSNATLWRQKLNFDQQQQQQRDYFLQLQQQLENKLKSINHTLSAVEHSVQLNKQSSNETFGKLREKLESLQTSLQDASQQLEQHSNAMRQNFEEGQRSATVLETELKDKLNVIEEELQSLTNKTETHLADYNRTKELLAHELGKFVCCVHSY